MIGRLILTWMVIATSLVCACTGMNDPEQKKDGLTIQTNGKNELKGVYHGPAGTIQFSSELGAKYDSISITTADGEPLIVNKKYQPVTTKHGGALPKDAGSQVPGQLLDHVEIATKFGKVSSALNDSKDVDAYLREAVDDLILSNKAELIIEAAKALGEAGVMGYENPSALQLFVLARQLTGQDQRHAGM